jgi:hypothetical protein
MFWGRLAAAKAGVPVILSALHSTGWPDCIERPNRWLTDITDGFIAVAPAHGRFLVEGEGFPTEKVFVIPNGVDVFLFRPDLDCHVQRQELGLNSAQRVVGIVAALRPKKTTPCSCNRPSKFANASRTRNSSSSAMARSAPHCKR